MLIPRATYRTQLTPAFGFQAAREIVPYLAELGISDVYGGGRGRTRLSFRIWEGMTGKRGPVLELRTPFWALKPSR